MKINEQNKNVLVVGRAGMDLYAEPAGTPIEKAVKFSSQLGGSAANIAAGLSIQGLNVDLLSGISGDAIGKFVVNSCKKLGIGIHLLEIIPKVHNTLAVVAASKGNFNIMVIGLLLSVFLIATLASYFAEYIKKHQWLGYVGLFVIFIIAIQLIIGGLVNLNVLSINREYEFLFSI